MATKLKITKEHDPGLYDSATGKSLKAQKVVDITDDCPSGERTILLFTRAERGRIVQIAHPYKGEAFMGAHIHFFIDELERPVRPQDDTFGSTAERAGLSKRAFRAIIDANAPTTT